MNGSALSQPTCVIEEPPMLPTQQLAASAVQQPPTLLNQQPMVVAATEPAAVLPCSSGLPANLDTSVGGQLSGGSPGLSHLSDQNADGASEVERPSSADAVEL
ncbi:hypothetical protein V6N13_087997 [Hibiscus sabdariffa]|uniref:Uncharacterized protein n=1 Tax=Hibiscus sabdariffa TaxID=183260 RepID=A0ABR2FXZ1_9ROSI